MATNNWQQSNIQYFWGEIAPNDHLVQIYDDENAFLNSLEGFVGSGFLSGEGVIVIATQEHLKFLNQRLISQGFNISKLISEDKFVPLDAEELLEAFMVNNQPDEKRFMKLVQGVVKRARKNDRKVRAFGEMVAVLSKKGQTATALELEQLWNKYCEKETLCLFCAYPRTSLTATGMQHVCCEHSKIISGSSGPSTMIYYKNVEKKVSV
jgi:hypothetical protein